MYNECICPSCESSNTKYIGSREDWDYKYVDRRCRDCGCEYTWQLVEVINKIEIKGEDD